MLAKECKTVYNKECRQVDEQICQKDPHDECEDVTSRQCHPVTKQVYEEFHHKVRCTDMAGQKCEHMLKEPCLSVMTSLVRLNTRGRRGRR